MVWVWVFWGLCLCHEKKPRLERWKVRARMDSSWVS